MKSDDIQIVPDPTQEDLTPKYTEVVPLQSSRKGMAIASLVLSIVAACGPLALVIFYGVLATPLLESQTDNYQLGTAALGAAALFFVEIFISPLAGVISFILAIIAFTKGEPRSRVIAKVAFGALGLALVLLGVQLWLYNGWLG